MPTPEKVFLDEHDAAGFSGSAVCMIRIDRAAVNAVFPGEKEEKIIRIEESDEDCLPAVCEVMREVWQSPQPLNRPRVLCHIVCYCSENNHLPSKAAPMLKDNTRMDIIW